MRKTHKQATKRHLNVPPASTGTCRETAAAAQEAPQIPGPAAPDPTDDPWRLWPRETPTHRRRPGGGASRPVTTRADEKQEKAAARGDTTPPAAPHGVDPQQPAGTPCARPPLPPPPARSRYNPGTRRADHRQRDETGRTGGRVPPNARAP